MDPIQNTWQFFQSLVSHHVHTCQANPSWPSIQSDLSLIDFPYLMQLLQQHRLELTLYPLLKKVFNNDHAFIVNLKQHCQVLTRKHLQQQQILLSLSRYFEEHQLNFVILKGQPLNQMLYGSICTRHSIDIDILIADSNIEQANEYLISQNFQCVSVMTPHKWLALSYDNKRLIKDFIYVNQQSQLSIELHVTINQMDTDIKLTQASQKSSVTIGGQSIPIFSLEENFLYLCLHGAKHNWQRMQWLVDVAILVQKYSLNHKKLYQLAHEWNRVIVLIEVQTLLKLYFGITSYNFDSTTKTKACVNYRIKKICDGWKLQKNDNQRNRRNRLKALLLASLLYITWKRKFTFFVSHFLSTANATEILVKHPEISKNSLIIHSFFSIFISFFLKKTSTPG